jgi:hypothetical protein
MEARLDGEVKSDAEEKAFVDHLLNQKRAL